MIMECMVTWEKATRAGLTLELRDVPSLVAVLMYGTGDPTQHHVPPAPFGTARERPRKLEGPGVAIAIGKWWRGGRGRGRRRSFWGRGLRGHHLPAAFVQH